ncbi:MAG: YihA family ribosome biogenesis GTP-binding protein [Candidatus Moranbacteria bacterium]|nr:YihA family ribosome biogenesis GTP-binding protein [Candidatus Moranbacteria bacterium]
MNITNAKFIRGVVGSHNLLVDEKPHIAFIGRSNVGKSSVINMLVNQRKLVKSSSTPGKTQQINFFLIDECCYFVDLPGYGYAKISRKRREKLRKLILWYFVSGEAPIGKACLIVDAKAGLRDFDREMMGVLTEYDIPFVVIANKIDKLNQKNLHRSLVSIQEEIGDWVEVFPISAKSGNGKEKLLKGIFRGVSFPEVEEMDDEIVRD